MISDERRPSERQPALGLALRAGAPLEELRRELARSYRLLELEGPAALLRSAREGELALVLLDAAAASDAKSALAELRSDARTRDIPVVIVAPGAEPHTLAALLGSGAADVVDDVRAPVALARVRAALGRGQQTRTLRSLAQTDPLTGLANLRALVERLEQEVRRAQRYGYALALVMLDLDHLKALNDRFGHPAGNEAILLLGRTLTENLRDADFAARFGGDEFVVLLPYQTAEAAAVFLQRLKSSLPALRLLDGEEVSLTFSAGIAAAPPGRASTAEQLLREADGALYEAKRRGRDQAVLQWGGARPERADVAT